MTRPGVVLVACLLPTSVLAQSLPPPRGSRVLGGVSFVGGVPTGSFGEVVDSAVGLDGQVSLTPRGGRFGLRVELAGQIYGSVTTRVPTGEPGGGLADQEIQNSIGRLSVGPLLVWRRGGLRPYACVTVGASRFATSTRVLAECDGRCDDDMWVREISSRTNYSETTFSWSAGGGVLLPLGPHGMVDLGVRYVGNGTVGWLAEGDVVEGANGQLQAYPRHTPANLVEITVGYTFGH